MRVKTNELTGAALDWAVAKCEGEEVRLIKGQLETLWRGIKIADRCVFRCIAIKDVGADLSNLSSLKRITLNDSIPAAYPNAAIGANTHALGAYQTAVCSYYSVLHFSLQENVRAAYSFSRCTFLL